MPPSISSELSIVESPYIPKEAKERTLRRLDGLEIDNVHANAGVRSRSPRKEIFWIPPTRTRRPNSHGRNGEGLSVFSEVWAEERGRRGKLVQETAPQYQGRIPQTPGYARSSHESAKTASHSRDPSLVRSVGISGFGDHSIRRRAQSEPRKQVRKEVRFVDGSRPRHAGSSAGIIAPGTPKSKDTTIPPAIGFTQASQAKRESGRRVSFDDEKRPRVPLHASGDTGVGQRRARSQEASPEHPEKRRRGGHRWFSIFERIPKHRWQSLGLL